jgi:CTP:molybdopterin cytidylyltransferase MocA
VTGPPPEQAAVVLAAGGGSRFVGESHKLLAPWRGRPLLLWAIDAALGAGTAQVWAVSGALDLHAVVPHNVEILHNPHWDRGQATSLGVALDTAQRRGLDAVVVGLGDQPLVPASAWRAVAAAVSAPIAVATYGGQRRNPVRLAREVWPLIEREGDQGARQVIKDRRDLVIEVACDGSPADIDTVEDLSRWI